MPHPNVLQLHKLILSTIPNVKHSKRRGFCFFFTGKKKIITYFCLREILFYTYFKPPLADIIVCSGRTTPYLFEVQYDYRSTRVQQYSTRLCTQRKYAIRRQWYYLRR